MAQSLSNQNTNAQSMNGLITVNANTITTGAIQTDTIDITNSGTLDIVPTDSTSATDTRLINAGWVNNKISNLSFTNLKIGDMYYGSGFTLGNSNLAISPNNQALNSNTTGQYNIAIGYGTLYNNTTPNSNIGIGTLVLQANNTGDTNIGIGDLSLYNNVSGINNIAMGYNSLSQNQTGSNNISFGNSANSGSAGTNTSNTVSIGSNVSTNKDNSIVIGYGSTNNYTNSSAIGYNITTNANNQFKIGRSDQTVRIDGGLDVVGTIVGNINSATKIYNTVTTTADTTTYNIPFATALGANGNASLYQISGLTYKPSTQQVTCGILSSDNIIGSSLTSGTNNLFNTTTTGAVKLANNLSGAGSVVVGTSATQLNNTFYGRTTLPPPTTNVIGGDTAASLFDYILYATNNNFSGEFTPKTSANFKYEPFTQTFSVTKISLNTSILSSPASSQYNFSFGDSTTMANCASGYWNTAIGQNALQNLSNGAGNICIGYNTGNSVIDNTDNICLGYSANSAVSTGNGNISLGAGSSTVNTSGNNNVVVGTSAQSTAGLGSQSSVVAVGTSSQVYTDNGIAIGNSAIVASGHTNSIAIGYNATTTASNQIQLGTSTQNVNCNTLSTSSLTTNAVSNILTIGGSSTIISSGVNSITFGSATSSGNYNYNGAQTTGTNNVFTNATTSAVNIATGQTSGILNVGNAGAKTGNTFYYGAQTTGSNNLFTNATTSAINIGSSQTTGILSVGNAGAKTGNTFYYGAQTTGSNNLFTNATTSAINIGTAQSTGALTLGTTTKTGNTNYYGAQTTGINSLFTNATTALVNIGTSLTTGVLTIGNASQVLIYGSTSAGGGGGTNSLFTNCDTTTVGIATGLTTGILNIGGGSTQSGAININAVNINLGVPTATIILNCNSLTLGTTAATGDFNYYGATTTGTNNLFTNASTSNIVIGNGLTTGTLSIGRFNTSTGDTNYYGTRTTGTSNLFTNVTTGAINIGINMSSGIFTIGRAGNELLMNSNLNLSSPLVQKQQTAPTQTYQLGYTLTAQVSPGTLVASTGTYSKELFGPVGGSPLPIQPNSATNFGLWYIQVSIGMTPNGNTYGAMSLGTSSAFNPSNAVSINYNMRDVGTTYAQVSGLFPIYTSTSYIYFYVKNLYTDSMVFPTNSVTITMTRVA